MTKVASLMLVAVLAGYGLHALAQARSDFRQTLTPMGTSSSNGNSFAWFYDTNERAVYVCRADGATVECKSKTTLP
jgi:hypothetical protein